MKDKLEAVIRHMTLISSRKVPHFNYKVIKPTYLILTPTSHGSLGDEAMIEASILTIKSNNPAANIKLLLWDSSDRYAVSHLNTESITIGPFLAKKATLFSIIKILHCFFTKIIPAFQRATHLIILGADTLDGRYSETRSLRRILLAEAGHHCGLSTRIVGFSFSDQATKETKNKISQLPIGIRLKCRERESALRLQSICHRRLHAMADIAILLRPQRPQSPNLVKMIENIHDRRRSGRTILAINVNYQAFCSSLDSQADVIIGAYETLLDYIHQNSNVSFLFIPHDYRGQYSDEAMLTQLYEKAANKLDIIYPQGRITAGEAKYFVSLADLTITGRMHLAIASIGTGVPAMAQDYQGKVEGLLASFELQHLKISTDEFLNPKKLGSRVISVLQEQGKLRTTITKNTRSIQNLARKNLSDD